MISPISRFKLSPVVATFLASLLLSLIATLSSTLNRDGMLYVRAARAFLDGGFVAAKAIFSWPFLSILIAGTSRLTGLELESAGHLLNALFMAGACALMVSCIVRRTPELGWLSGLVLLALPGLNEYRSELLREFGCWFFVMLAFWLALRWEDRLDWTGATATHLALLGAALFRPEALTLFAALIAWQFAIAPRGKRWRRLIMIGALPIIAGTVLVGLYFSGQLGGTRLAGEFSRLSVTRFDAKAQVLAGGLIDYARGNAQAILFFGSLALIPLKLLQKYGLLLIPLAYLFASGGARVALQRHPIFAWGICIHLLVLAVFVTDLQFLAGRYVGLLLLFSAPFAATGLGLIVQRWPRGHWPLIAIGIALALANVVSTSQGKGHFAEAGRWLAMNATETTRIYIDSPRTAFHAQWNNVELMARNDRPTIAVAAKSQRYDLFVLEKSRKDPPIDSWLEEESGLRIIQRFGQREKDEVIVAWPKPSAP